MKHNSFGLVIDWYPDNKGSWPYPVLFLYTFLGWLNLLCWIFLITWYHLTPVEASRNKCNHFFFGDSH